MPMPAYKNTNSSMVYGLLAMLLICVLAVTGPLGIRPALNNLSARISLQKFVAAFQDLQHPVGTERLSLRTSMGDFAGIDQGCDFYVGEVRSFSGSKQDISVAYTDQEIGGNPLQVVYIESGQIPAKLSNSLPEPLDNLSGWGLP